MDGLMTGRMNGRVDGCTGHQSVNIERNQKVVSRLEVERLELEVRFHLA